MVFYVGTKQRREFLIRDLGATITFDLEQNHTIQWIFKFANGDLVKLDGIVDINNDIVEFLTPKDLFTPERKGPCRHSLRIKEVGTTGIDDLTTPITEDVIDGVATPDEIDNITPPPD